MLLYFVKFRPLKETQDNSFEIFNEFVIMLLNYSIWVFTDFQRDGEVKFQIGWLYSGAIILTVLVNFYPFLKELKSKIKSKKYKKVKKQETFTSFTSQHVQLMDATFADNQVIAV